MTICSERISSYLGRWLAATYSHSTRCYRGVKPANNQDVQKLEVYEDGLKLEVTNFEIDIHNILI